MGYGKVGTVLSFRASEARTNTSAHRTYEHRTQSPLAFGAVPRLTGRPDWGYQKLSLGKLYRSAAALPNFYPTL